MFHANEQNFLSWGANDITIAKLVLYTLSVFIDRKKPCTIIDALMTEWIAKFGVMKALMTDNGGEFNADEVREITSILNIQLCTTSGESPFQNGLCERVHAITDMMLVKLEADYRKKNSQTLLSWANMARNSLQMWNGYSSHQLVFGQNPNLPNIMSDTLPASQGSTSSEVFAQHLNDLHATRRAFIQTEANERVRWALRNKVRASEQVFEHGDRVFYKREGKEHWLSPGKVVFQDGKVVFVRHGGVFVRASPNRLQTVISSLADEEEKEGENSIKDKTDENKGHEERTEPHTISEDIPAPEPERIDRQNIEQNRNTPEPERMDRQNIQQNRTTLKPNDSIQYKTQNTDEWIKATVLGRAGKATGKNKHSFSIQEKASKEKKSVNLEQIQLELINNDETVNLVTRQNNDTTAAKLVELQKLSQFHTYDEVKDCGQQTLSTRWVITN